MENIRKVIRNETMSNITICDDGYRPVIAYNEVNNEYLVVWMYSYCDPADDATILRDIYAQRVRSYGALIGDRITVAKETSTRTVLPGAIANVVYNRAANEYLVIWDYQYSWTEFTIRARRVSSDGRLVGNESSISTHLSDESRSVIAYNSRDNEYLFVRESGWPNREHDIIARRVASDGRPVGTHFNIATSLKNETRPVIAYNSSANEYLVVWEYWYSDTDLDLRARRVASDGRPVGTHFSIAVSQKNETRPAIAYNSSANEYLVVWEHQHSLRDVDIHACPVGSGGDVGDSFTIAGTLESENLPVIAYNTKASEYLVVWGSYSWPSAKIIGQRLKDG
ncbi:hypothetical protein C5S53_09600 [Methanophagales archaeon]|nr:hypothetical protein C5S53_09600 [Methanophagales archaeon]